MSLDETMEWARLPGYVEQADGNDIRLWLLDDRQAAALHDLGWAFSAGREWSPAEVFEHLREQGWLHGSYRRLAWMDPNDPRLSRA